MPGPQPQQPVAPETVGVVIGNHTQKYRARNPAIRWLTGRWVANLDQLFTRSGPPRLTLITCGGPFLPEFRSYRDNVVVVAEPVR